MSEGKILTRWLKYVARGEGSERTFADERYSYIGNVLYSNKWPVARLVKMPSGNYCCLTRTGAKPSVLKDSKKPNLVKWLYVPCVGAYTRFPADMISDEELHERIKWLCHQEAQDCVERALRIPPNLLLTGGEDARLRQNLRSTIARYKAYSEIFDLNWKEFPDTYHNEFEGVIASRDRAYSNPKEVEKRERAKARKDAKQALLG
jgi:hypothetical protein